MSSQFDALLDFGDDPPPSTNGTAQKTNGSDDFDPFGPGPVDSSKGGASDGGLLLDFSVTTEVRRNEDSHHAPAVPVTARINSLASDIERLLICNLPLERDNVQVFGKDAFF